MDILNYALAKKIFGKGTSGGGGESGVPLKVTKLPEASSKSVGKVYFVDQKATPKVGDVLGDKLYFDTTKNPMDYLVNAGGDGNPVPILVADIDSEPAFQLLAMIQPIGDGYLCLLVGVNADYSGAFLYVNSNVLTVEQYNQEAAGQGMPAVTEFGWQVEEMDISPVTGATISYVGEGAEVVQTDGGSAYYLGTEEKSSFAVGSPLGNKIRFDTTKNPADFGIPPGEMAPVLYAENENYNQFQVIVGEALGGGEQGTCYMVMCGDLASQGDISNLIYVQCDVLTVDQFNEMMGSQMGFTIAEFGWQTDVYDSSAYADYVVQENYLPMLGNFAYGGTEYLFEKANGELFEVEINALRSEKDVLQEQYDEANNLAVLLGNSAKELYLPDGTILEEGMFTDTLVNLTKVSLPTIDFPFYKCFGESTTAVPSSLTDVEIRGGVICKQAFQFGESLRNLTIGDGVTRIGESAFSVCTNLSNVTIPSSVTRIDGFAFSSCKSLTDIVIPDSVTYLSGYLFQGCTNLANVTLGNNVTDIGVCMFNECSNLTSVNIPDGVKRIGQSAFNDCTSLASITIPSSVTRIDDHAFIRCYGLTSIIIPEGVPEIESSTFAFCTSLASVTIPNSVTSIGESAFRSCSSLTNITIPDSVTSIGNYAFDRCSGLTNVTINNGVKTIGADAFSFCDSLASITIPSSVTSIGNNAFGNSTNITDVYIYDIQKWWDISFVSYYSNPIYSSNTRNLHILDDKGNEVTELVVPDSVTSIDRDMCRGLTSITNITIPSSVTEIGVNAFVNCTNLTSVRFESTTPPSFGSYVFDTSNDALVIYVPEESVQAYKRATNLVVFASKIQPIVE